MKWLQSILQLIKPLIYIKPGKEASILEAFDINAINVILLSGSILTFFLVLDDIFISSFDWTIYTDSLFFLLIFSSYVLLHKLKYKKTYVRTKIPIFIAIVCLVLFTTFIKTDNFYTVFMWPILTLFIFGHKIGGLMCAFFAGLTFYALFNHWGTITTLIDTSDRIVFSVFYTFLIIVMFIYELLRLITFQIYLKQRKALEDSFNQKLELQSELEQSRKLESIGILAAGIAHEINTPVQYVRDNIVFFKKYVNDTHALFLEIKNILEKKERISRQCINQLLTSYNIDVLGEESRMALQESTHGLDQISGIIQAMKRSVYINEKEMKHVNINESLKQTITITKNKWKYVAEMEIRLDESLPPIKCYSHDIQQVFINLILNAIHAIADANKQQNRDSGKITVQTQKQGDHCLISISDTGGGIPKDIKKNIFDPFFTTKEIGIGTGQGLSISRSIIVEKHKGKIWFESKKDGSVFYIQLPIR